MPRSPHPPRPLARTALVLALVLARPSAGQGQVTREDYQRADSLAELLPDLVVGEAEEPHWLDDGSGRFWYRVSVEGGDRFVLVEPDLPRKGPAF
ncbi:MAG: hypothetical protein PVI57_08330, partial [Gemmatimonadota bacterium]